MHRNEPFIMEIVYNLKRYNCIKRGEIAFLRFAANRLIAKKGFTFWAGSDRIQAKLYSFCGVRRVSARRTMDKGMQLEPATPTGAVYARPAARLTKVGHWGNPRRLGRFGRGVSSEA